MLLSKSQKKKSSQVVCLFVKPESFSQTRQMLASSIPASYITNTYCFSHASKKNVLIKGDEAVPDVLLAYRPVPNRLHLETDCFLQAEGEVEPPCI